RLSEQAEAMSGKYSAVTLVSLAFVVTVGVLLWRGVHAHSSTTQRAEAHVERTVDGQPDLQGNWTTVNDALTPFERLLPGQAAEALNPSDDGVSEEEDLANRLKAVTE